MYDAIKHVCLLTNRSPVVTLSPRTPVELMNLFHPSTSSSPHALGSQLSVAQTFRLFMASFVALVFLTAPLAAQETWSATTSGTSEQISSVAFGNHTFVAVGEGGVILQSTDFGATWQNRSNLDLMPDGLVQVAYGNGVFLAVSRNGVIRSTDNGKTWQAVAASGDGWVNGIVYGNGRWVVAGAEYAWTSVNNGDSWTPLPSAKIGGHLLFANNVFLSGGESIWVSDDGQTWTDVAGGEFNWLSAIGYGNGLYMVVGTVFLNTISKTTNPRLWTEEGAMTTEYGGLLGIAYGNDRFVVVGEEGVILTSAGSPPWEKRASGTTHFLTAIAYGDGAFVVVGDQGTILISGRGPEIDGALTATGTVGSAFAYSITAKYGPTGFDASNLPAGLSINPSTGQITGTPTTAGSFTVGLTASNSFGEDSKTLTLTINPSGGTEFKVNIYTAVELEVATKTGKSYQVQTSPDLKTWSNYGAPIPGTGATSYWLYSTRNPNQRFYRAVEQ
jgi:hypothetical protein